MYNATNKVHKFRTIRRCSINACNSWPHSQQMGCLGKFQSCMSVEIHIKRQLATDSYWNLTEMKTIKKRC